jgi:heptosyltransferase-1
VRVLIVRIGAMGDVLHALPAVAALRARHPEWFIGWAIEPRWSDLLQIAGDPEDLLQGPGPMERLPVRYATERALIDRWYSVTATEWKQHPLARRTASAIGGLKDVLRGEAFDVCVDMQGAVKSAVVGRLAGASVYVGPDAPRERIARLLYGQRVESTSTHVVNQACELLGAAVGETLQPARVPLPMDTEAEHWADGLVGHKPFCLISSGGGWGAKMWPAERYGQVAKALKRAGLSTLVNASPSGSPEADAVVAASDGAAQAAPCSVRRLIALTRRAAVIVGGDTGPLHLGAALERPVVGIYGPTDPARNGPFGTKARVLRDASSTTSHKRVDEVEEGMLRIGVDEVVTAALSVLDRAVQSELQFGQ